MAAVLELQGPDFVLTRGPRPHQPRGPALPVRPPAARARFGAARWERSAHNEALSDVAAVPSWQAGARAGGKEEAGWPPAPATSPTRAEGPRLGGGVRGGGTAGQGRAPEGPGSEEAQVGSGVAGGALFGGGL